MTSIAANRRFGIDVYHDYVLARLKSLLPSHLQLIVAVVVCARLTV
jgi:hypothetical protein